MLKSEDCKFSPALLNNFETNPEEQGKIK